MPRESAGIDGDSTRNMDSGWLLTQRRLSAVTVVHFQQNQTDEHAA